MVPTIGGIDHLFLNLLKNIQISKQHEVRKLEKITLGNHAPWSFMTWLPETFSVLDMTIV